MSLGIRQKETTYGNNHFRKKEKLENWERINGQVKKKIYKQLKRGSGSKRNK